MVAKDQPRERESESDEDMMGVVGEDAGKQASKPARTLYYCCCCRGKGRRTVCVYALAVHVGTHSV